MLLILSFAASMLYVTPTTKGATITQTIHTWLYVGTSAGGGGVADVGVGQQMLITAWTKDMPPDIGETAHLVQAPNGRAGWDGVTVTVTKPDNSTETLIFPHSDPVGNNYVTYVPQEPGTYTIVANFPAVWKNSTNPTESHETGYPNILNTYYTSAVSPVETFTVTQEQTPMFPESPLPQDYWTRPISGASRMWYVLEGNKLGGASAVWPSGAAGGTTNSYYYGDSPLSSHILWSKPYAMGGVMDDRFNGTSIPSETFQTTHYTGVSFTADMIIDGKIYWNPRMTSAVYQGVEVIDLYTGNTLYLNYSDTPYDFGSIYNYNSPNQMGGFAYLWKSSASYPIALPEIIDVANATLDKSLIVQKLGPDYLINTTKTTVKTGTIWEMVDPRSQAPVTWICNVSTAGTNVYGIDGSILYYNIVNKGTTANPNYYCTVWNSSAGTMVGAPDGTGYWCYRPGAGSSGGDTRYFLGSNRASTTNIVHDGNNFYSQNFSIPSIIGPDGKAGTIRCIRQDQYMIVGSAGLNDGTNASTQGWMEGISLAPSNKGQKLWSMTYTPPFADPALSVTGMTLTGVYPEDGVLTWADTETLQRWVYDLYSGSLLWTSPPEAQYEYYGMSQTVYNHMLIGSGRFAGQLIAYDIRTGNQLWNYSATNVGFESPYGNYPISIDAIDGYNNVIYTTTSEHHNIQPMYRGQNLRCINASNGQEIWKILDFGSGISIADGILVKGDNLDNMIYAYGKGPSATTVSAPQTNPLLGSSVTIIGTVTDQSSSGRHNTNDQIDFTLKGTPAISDTDMAAWMEYKFKQQAKPTDAKGVPVSLDAIDPNGNYVHIGTVTSDITGTYGCDWTPQVPGTYKIIATFAGSASYGPSSAQTYMSVQEPTGTTAPSTAPQPQTVADIYLLPGIVAIIIAIALVGAVLALLTVRKRP